MSLSLPETHRGFEPEPLTPRETEVLRMIAQGYTGTQIARATYRSNETIKRQLFLARQKLGARTTTHAVALAISFDMI